MNIMNTDERDEIERQVQVGAKRIGLDSYDNRRPARFDSVEGCCRDCEHALIRTRKYDDSPRVMCCVTERPHAVPLDIKDCSSYRKKGQPSAASLTAIALLIDPRDQGGQYL